MKTGATGLEVAQTILFFIGVSITALSILFSIVGLILTICAHKAFFNRIWKVRLWIAILCIGLSVFSVTFSQFSYGNFSKFSRRKLNYQISSPLWYGLFVALVITLGALMKSYNNKKRCFPCLGQEAFSFLVSIFFGIVTAILQVVFVILDLFHIFDSVKPTGVIVFESWIGLVQKGVGIICVLFALLYYGLGVRKFKNSVMNVHMRKTLTTQTVIMMVAIVIVALASLCNTLFLTLVSERIADRDVELHPEYGNNQDVDELPGLNTIHVSATLADDLPSFIIMLCLFFFTIHTVLHFVIIPVISSLRYPVTLLKDEPSQPSSGASSKENAQERTSSSSSSSSSHTNTSETAAAAASASGMPRSVLVEMKPLDSADTSSVNNAV